jgi:hypothetical protein
VHKATEIGLQAADSAVVSVFGPTVSLQDFSPQAENLSSMCSKEVHGGMNRRQCLSTYGSHFRVVPAAGHGGTGRPAGGHMLRGPGAGPGRRRAAAAAGGPAPPPPGSATRACTAT